MKTKQSNLALEDTRNREVADGLAWPGESSGVFFIERG